MRRYLVTGGAGFIGSNFIRLLLAAEPRAEVINLDLLTYAAAGATVNELDQLDRYQLVRGDIRDPRLVDATVDGVDVIVNFAAESHVDRSIAGPADFLSTNFVGTGVLLEAANKHRVDRFVHVSTDEVYGSISVGAASESSPLNPSSPYAAAKAAADMLVFSYEHTYGYQAITTRCTNNYGPYQHPEKLIPLAISRLLNGEPVPIYGDGLQQRSWLWVTDHCAAIRLVVDEGTPGAVYNVGADSTATNRDVVDGLIEAVGSGSVESVADRPGHDRRYAVDSSRLRALGWEPTVDLDEGLNRTVAWYKAHQSWWRPLLEDV